MGLLPLLETPYWYAIVERTAGLYFLAPKDECFRGHSLWRIWQARAAEERGDYSTAAWFLQGQKVIEGPEHSNNTPIPTVNEVVPKPTEADVNRTFERIGQQYASDT